MPAEVSAEMSDVALHYIPCLRLPALTSVVEYVNSPPQLAWREKTPIQQCIDKIAATVQCCFG